MISFSIYFIRNHQQKVRKRYFIHTIVRYVLYILFLNLFIYTCACVLVIKKKNSLFVSEISLNGTGRIHGKCEKGQICWWWCWQKYVCIHSVFESCRFCYQFISNCLKFILSVDTFFPVRLRFHVEWFLFIFSCFLFSIVLFLNIIYTFYNLQMRCYFSLNSTSNYLNPSNFSLLQWYLHIIDNLIFVI